MTVRRLGFRPAGTGVSEICTVDWPFATDPSQLIPEYAQKFPHQTGLGEWPEC